VSAAARDILIVIPARFASQRFPGKLLAPLRGADGVARPLIEHSWRAANALRDLADVVIATDDAAIAEAAAGFGARCVMTSTAARNGTERCAEAMAALETPPALVVNWQGDSPAIARAHVEALIAASRDGGGPVLTPFMRCSPAMRAHLAAEIAAGRPSGVFVVADRAANALYFSRSPIPWGQDADWRLHVGLYAYEPSALARYAAWPPGALEVAESLEQLRFLENGQPIALVEVEPAVGGYGDVNYPADIAKVEALLRERGAP
jgi:3-deoxy-manno-octulosonate cytidylyltransferase (CMP-KDO synthetase)